MPIGGRVALPLRPPGPLTLGRGSVGGGIRRVFDTFAGAGGLSIGLGHAGFDIVAGAEWDSDACETFANVHPGARVLEGDMNAMSFSPWRGVIDVVVGGPPCQPWSTGGKRLGAEDPRDGWPAFLRVLQEIRPEAFVAENVAGLVSGARAAQFRWLFKEFEDLEFKVAAEVLNAADHGVPQRRHRLFIVGLRNGIFAFPLPQFGPSRAKPWRSAGEFLRHQPIGRPNPSIVTYACNPDLRPNPYDGHVFNGGGRPIDPKKPAPTLLAAMGGNKTPWIDTLGIVPKYHAHLMAGGEPRAGPVPGARRITVEEAAALQTFPAGMHFTGARSSRYRQIGNAVPPLLARVIGEELRRQLSA